jgi:hypothetical protein
MAKKKARRGMTRDQILVAAKAHEQRVAKRFMHRDSSLAGVDTSIPADVMTFLDALYATPPLTIPNSKDVAADGRLILAIDTALRDAYRQGCTQGYVEGFVARREPDRQRSRKANAAKASRVVTVGNTTMTRAERNEAIVDEYPILLQLMKPTPAKQRLAGKYGFESWQGVDAVLKRAAARKPQ